MLALATQPSLTSRGQSSPCRDLAHDIHPKSVVQAHAVGDTRGPDELGGEAESGKGGLAPLSEQMEEPLWG